MPAMKREGLARTSSSSGSGSTSFFGFFFPFFPVLGIPGGVMKHGAERGRGKNWSQLGLHPTRDHVLLVRNKTEEGLSRPIQ